MKYVAAMILLVATAAGCSRSGSAPSASGRHAWTQPGVLRIATIQESKTLNPLLASTTDDGFIDRLMFEPLLSADPAGNPVPMLAASVPTIGNGGVSRDGLTIVYHLRKDAFWTDGVPVTSRDVKWSWQAIVNPNDNVISRHGYDIVRAIETPDDHTVTVRLKRRFAPFVNTFFAESDQPYDVVPAHVLAKYPNVNQVPFNGEPTVSDGPFKFVSWVRGDRIVLAANPRFFKGRPGLSRILIQVVPDENTGINLLRTHAIDYLFQASIATYPELKDAPDVKLVWVNMNAFDALEFNVARVPNPLVRLAIAYALDKPSLVARLTHGQEKVATEDLPDWMWAFDPTVKSYPYDVAKAKALLARAGGSPHLLLATENANATHREESLLVQEALRRIGLDVEIKYYPQAVLYATAAMGGILQGGKFDLTLAPWYGGIDPDDSSQFLCSTFPPNGYNTSRYCNPDMEAAQRRALDNYDQVIRASAYGRIQHILARDNPYVFFWWQRQLEAISVDFKGFSPNPSTESWNAWQWRI
ncbi:MAG TPA: peptide ABC transporter substrate-binding protein [Candidatus Tumulicola sp.]|jgi:peptide/nickel transport system substrate-binding protein